MNNASRTCGVTLALAFLAVGLGQAQCVDPLPGDRIADGKKERQQRQEARRRFQSLELITAKPFSFIFNPGDPPRIVWRDAEEARRLGADEHLRVRWFDAQLYEVTIPNTPGRWGAWIEGTAPNGTPLRRAMTFYARPPGFLFYRPPGLVRPLDYQPGPIAANVWRGHEPEIARTAEELLARSFNDSEAIAILLAGLAEAKQPGQAPHITDSAAMFNDDYHLALKLKVTGLARKVCPLAPPRRRTPSATMLHEGLMAEAQMKPDAKAKIDAVCRAWCADTGEPLVTLVARHGVVVTHEAFGSDAQGKPVSRDYRCEVFSITKSVTGLLFSQFVDQGLIGLDDSLATVFPDYPRHDPHVPTFRQCFTHTSGLAGHGDWGGMRNPHLENIILNAIDVNEPGKVYSYSGMGFDLVAKAMEIVSGTSALRLYAEHLFRPLGFDDVPPLSNASSGARLTAWELGVLAQWVANRGSYGQWEFISPQTFDRLLPEPLGRHYPGIVAEDGIGMHWIKHAPPKAAAGKDLRDAPVFGPRTLGHGSLSGCIFQIDLENDLIVVQARKQTGPRYAEWSDRLFQAVAEARE